MLRPLVLENMSAKNWLPLRALYGTDETFPLGDTRTAGEVGGQMSQMGIAPGAVTGYIEPLRENNSAGDGEELSIPVLNRMPKSPPTVNARNGGGISERGSTDEPCFGRSTRRFCGYRIYCS